MPVLSELEKLSRQELIDRALRFGVPRPELMTRVELTDEIVRRSETDPAERKRARGWLGIARDLVASVLEQGLHLPDAAALIRGDVSFELGVRAPAPVATVTLAEIYAAQGHLDRAVKMLDQVLEKEPDHDPARVLRDRFIAERERRAATKAAARAREAERKAALEAEAEADAWAEADADADADADAEAEAEAEAKGEAEAEPVAAEQEPAEAAPVAAEGGLAEVEPVAAEQEPAEAAPVAAEGELAEVEPVMAEPEPAAAAFFEPELQTLTELGPVAAPEPEPQPVVTVAAEREPVADVVTQLGPVVESPSETPAESVPEQAVPLERAFGPTHDSVVVMRSAAGKVRVYWEMRPESRLRAERRWPDGRAVVRVVGWRASWEGAQRVEHDVEVAQEQSSATIDDLGDVAAVRVALGWVSAGELHPFSLATELAAGASAADPQLRWIPPGHKSLGSNATVIAARALEHWGSSGESG